MSELLFCDFPESVCAIIYTDQNLAVVFRHVCTDVSLSELIFMACSDAPDLHGVKDLVFVS